MPLGVFLDILLFHEQVQLGVRLRRLSIQFPPQAGQTDVGGILKSQWCRTEGLRRYLYGEFSNLLGRADGAETIDARGGHNSEAYILYVHNGVLSHSLPVCAPLRGKAISSSLFVISPLAQVRHAASPLPAVPSQ